MPEAQSGISNRRQQCKTRIETAGGKQLVTQRRPQKKLHYS